MDLDEDSNDDTTEGPEQSGRRRNMLQDGSAEASPGLNASSADSIEEQLSGMLDTIEGIASSVAGCEGSVLTLLSQTAVLDTGASDAQDVTKRFTDLLGDANDYFGATQGGGEQVMKAAQSTLEKARALTRDLGDLAADLDDSLSQSNVLLANTLFQIGLLLTVSEADSGTSEEIAPCPMEDSAGWQRIEFRISSDDANGEAVRRRGRSLLIGGGKSSSSKGQAAARPTTRRIEKLLGGGMTYNAALRATSSAIQQNSWTLIKQHATNSTIDRLSNPASTTTPLPGLSTGILLHLQRKVRGVLGTCAVGAQQPWRCAAAMQ